MNKSPIHDDEPVIQTVAEPLQQLLQQAAAPPAKTKSTKAASPKVHSFRPTNRPPLAVLTIFDDGSREEGEVIRIRQSKVNIGREKGDITIPFDSDISGKHAELRCQKQKGKYRWYLIDRESTNGTFLRAYRASLSRETELVLGSRRYLFQLPDHHGDAEETDALQTNTYQAPSRRMLEKLVPRLVEAGIQADKARTFSIGESKVLIGSDSKSCISIEEDPFLSPIHARIYKNETERWMIEDKKSLNGVWIRVKKFALDRPAEFQLGQQRFRFQPNVS